MSFSPEDSLDEWYLDLDKVSKDTNRLSVTKYLALQLIQNPYLSVGSFIKGLSDRDIQTLLDLSDSMNESDNEDPPEDCQDLLLITIMLAKAEGTYAKNIEDLQHHLGALTLFVAGASLHRKGLVEAFYDNMSFNEDMSNESIFKKIDE